MDDPTVSKVAGGKTLRISKSGTAISDINVNFTETLNWSSVTADIDLTYGKSVIANLTTAPGAASTHSLYIPIPHGVSSSQVVICPTATTISAVPAACSGAVTFVEGQTQAVGSDTVTVTKVIINAREYWKATGVSGTGGISLINEFGLRDTLTRLQISTASNHTIDFGSVNATDTSGDTIAIQFDPVGQNWNLSSITVSDIDMEDDGVDATLAAAAGASTWGANINTSTATVTLTAPTRGTG